MDKEKIIKLGAVAIGGYFLLNIVGADSAQKTSEPQSVFQPSGMFDFGGSGNPPTYSNVPEYSPPAPSNISIIQEAPNFPTNVFPVDKRQYSDSGYSYAPKKKPIPKKVGTTEFLKFIKSPVLKNKPTQPATNLFSFMPSAKEMNVVNKKKSKQIEKNLFSFMPSESGK